MGSHCGVRLLKAPKASKLLLLPLRGPCAQQPEASYPGKARGQGTLHLMHLLSLLLIGRACRGEGSEFGPELTGTNCTNSLSASFWFICWVWCQDRPPHVTARHTTVYKSTVPLISHRGIFNVLPSSGLLPNLAPVEVGRARSWAPLLFILNR